MNKEQESALLRQLHAALDAEVESIPPAIRQRLRQARHEAIEAGSRRKPLALSHWFTFRQLWPASTAIALTLLLTSGYLLRDGALSPTQFTSSQEIAELLADTEFYQWLGITAKDSG